MIHYIILDNTRVNFINGKPPRIKNQKARNLPDGYNYQEILLLDDMKRRNFIYVISPIYAYIKRQIPNKKLTVDLFIGLAWFFSIELGIPISREFYRRKTTSIFWMQLHYQAIKLFIQRHLIIINYNNTEYLFE